MGSKNSSFRKVVIGKVWLMLLLLSARTGLAAGGGWQALPAAPVGIGNFAGGAFGADLIVAGGITWREASKVWLDGIWRFDTRKRTWRESGKLPHPVAYAAYGQTGEGMIFVGGGDGKRSLPESGWLDGRGRWRMIGVVPQPLVYSGSCIGGREEQLRRSSPSPRPSPPGRGGIVGSSAANSDHDSSADAGGLRLYVVAGATDAADLSTATNLFYSVRLKTGRVEDLGEFPGGKVVLSAAAALGGQVYVFGGATLGSTNNPAVNVDSAWVYSIAEGKWSGLKPFLFPARGVASCVLDERHILLAGGYLEDFTDEAFVYDTKTGNYSRTILLPYRAMTCLIKSGGDVYCIGGEDRKQHRSDLIFKIKWREFLEAANSPIR